jgi:hypothetical protein
LVPLRLLAAELLVPSVKARPPSIGNGALLGRTGL